MDNKKSIDKKRLRFSGSEWIKLIENASNKLD